MKKILTFLFFATSLVTADEQGLEFYEPNISNAFQGRLSYDPTNQDYPINKMRELCDSYTGVDTAQIKCEKQNQVKIMVCEYKCSMHWSVKD